MNNRMVLRAGEIRFSLRHLLTITALIAVGLAINIAFRRNKDLRRVHSDLLVLSSRIKTKDGDQVSFSAIPQIASGFYSWNTYIPENTEYELRLGVGTVSADGIPPVVGRCSVPAGHHRVTLHTGDSPEQEFRFAVFLDGELAIETKMGKDWLPGGWSSSSSISWPHDAKNKVSSVQLAGKRYEAKRELGDNHYFNGQTDELVSRLGFRLWFDLPQTDHPPASPYVGMSENSQLFGIGLRDGIRFRPNTYPLELTCPQLETLQPILRLRAEFLDVDQEGLAGQTHSFSTWKVQRDLSGIIPNRNATELDQASKSIFIQADVKTPGSPQPILELKWIESDPDHLFIRLADSPSNEFVKRWRLRIVDGSYHLWRTIQVGDTPPLSSTNAFENGEMVPNSENKSSRRRIRLTANGDVSSAATVKWKTDKTLPLQIEQRKSSEYAGMRLYQGVPISFSSNVPDRLMPTFTIEVADQLLDESGTTFPEGPVIDAVEIELGRSTDEWIRLGVHAIE